MQPIGSSAIPEFMQPERWQQIDQLLEATLALPVERRASFLAEACAEDETLRQEVASLLRAEEQAESFMETPAVGLAAEVLADQQARVAKGQQLGPYQILAPLGKGGMGEVFLAQDTRLGRKVALKLLPIGLAAEAEAKRRFTQEARTASSLNHSHIITIYDIGTDEGRDFIAMEYIEGDSLRNLLTRERSELKRTIELMAQAASGLAAAHEAHILHRDIKPENLMVTRSGQLKILDFGLAKLSEKQRATLIASDVTTAPLPVAETKPGTILGTVAYMSPEQAAGRTLDQRTDIFSLGVVLYEMLTAQRPFQGKSAVDVLHAIINEEPRPPLEINPRLPVEVTEILSKALAKEVSERYQHAGDFELDLRRLKRAIESNSLLSAKAQTPQPATRTAALSLNKIQRLTVTALIVVALALGAVGAWLIGRGAGRATPTWTTARTIATQLTNYGGTEAGGALSPDGKSFVFVSDHGGTPDIWLRQIAGGEPVRLTNDAAEEADPIYAPDGETIYFTRSDGSDTSIWRNGVLGGQARRVIGKARKPVPSPDGRSLAYFISEPDNPSNSALVVSALDGSGTRTLARGLGLGVIRAAWSPDGRWLSYARRGLSVPHNLFIVEVATGQTRQVTQFNRSNQTIEAQTWLPDNRHLVISYVPQPTVGSDLGVLDIQDGSISRLTLNIGDTFNSLSVSADGTRLIATINQHYHEVWKVPLGPDPLANGRAAVRVLDSSQDPQHTFVSRDGRTLLFNNAAPGNLNLWTMPLGGSAPPRQITTFLGDHVMHSSLSPDGSHVAFASQATGNSDIWVQNVDGSELRQLTNDEAADAWPVWSPDGKWIVFNSNRGGRRETWQVPAEGGAAEKVVDSFFRGDLIRQPGGTGTWLVSTLQGKGIRLMDFERRAVLWDGSFEGEGLSLPMFSADARFISALRRESRDRDAIWIYETATGKSHLAVRFPEPFRMEFRACWVDGDKALIVNRYFTPSRIVFFNQFWVKEGAQN